MHHTEVGYKAKIPWLFVWPQVLCCLCWQQSTDICAGQSQDWWNRTSLGRSAQCLRFQKSYTSQVERTLMQIKSQSNQIYFSTTFNIAYMCIYLQFNLLYIVNAQCGHFIAYGSLPKMPMCCVQKKKTEQEGKTWKIMSDVLSWPELTRPDIPSTTDTRQVLFFLAHSTWASYENRHMAMRCLISWADLNWPDLTYHLQLTPDKFYLAVTWYQKHGCYVSDDVSAFRNRNTKHELGDSWLFWEKESIMCGVIIVCIWLISLLENMLESIVSKYVHFLFVVVTLWW